MGTASKLYSKESIGQPGLLQFIIGIYAHLDASHHFVLVAVETSEALKLFWDLGHRLREANGEQVTFFSS